MTEGQYLQDIVLRILQVKTREMVSRLNWLINGENLNSHEANLERALTKKKVFSSFVLVL